MIQDDFIAKLSLLSKRELEVLRYVCDGETYEIIGEKLFISKNTVKTHMGHVYEKLGLVDLNPSQRRKVLYQDVCMALGMVEFENELPESEDTLQEPEPISEDILTMVEEDEKAIVLYPQGEIIEVPLPPTQNGERIGRTRWIIGGMILGSILTLLCVFLGWGIYQNTFLGEETDEIPVSLASEVPSGEGQATLISEDMTPEPTTDIVALPEITIASTSTPTIIPTITYTPLPSATPIPILFEDDFEDGLDPAWVILDGDPIVSNGRLNANEHTWLTIGIPTWTNYSVEFYGKCSSYEFVQRSPCITGVRAQDKENMVAVRWSYYDLEWVIFENGNWDNVPDTRYRKVNNNPYDLKINADQNNYIYYVRGENKPFSKEIYSQGYIVFWLRAGSWIDDFKVIALP